MLDALTTRVVNNPDDELKVAVEEQRKITRLRIVKLLE
jgi:2-oxo-4-hydroxy-4-carboxy--5-ureidoimidazoline (OHCU) decarboxylase